MSAGHLCDPSTLLMRIQNLVKILENLCVTKMHHMHGVLLHSIILWITMNSMKRPFVFQAQSYRGLLHHPHRKSWVYNLRSKDSLLKDSLLKTLCQKTLCWKLFVKRLFVERLFVKSDSILDCFQYVRFIVDVAFLIVR